MKVPDVNVGNGPVTISGMITTAAMWLFALSTGLITIAGALPDSVSPRIAVWLITIGGVLGAVSLGITAVARAAFANVKIAAMQQQNGTLAPVISDFTPHGADQFGDLGDANPTAPDGSPTNHASAPTIDEFTLPQVDVNTKVK